MMDEILMRYLDAGQVVVSNLLLYNYRDLGLDESEFILILQLLSRDQQGKTVDLNEISQAMHLQDSQLGEVLRGLLEKKILRLVTKTDAAGKKYDKYDLSLLYAKLFKFQNELQEKQVAKQAQTDAKSVYQGIEVEFGRPLSPMELQTIDLWLNMEKYPPELILLALKEAVLNQVYNLKYIDRILLSWEKQNIKTSADVLRNQQKRRHAFENTERPKERGNRAKPSIPMYDWSKDD